MELGGVIAPLLTPFTSTGDVDYEQFELQAVRVLASGAHGLSPGGSTGEGAMLTDDELVRLTEIARKVAGEDHPVVAGVIRQSTAAASEAARRVAAAGADALMVTPTCYNILVPDSQGNQEFFADVHAASGLPVVVYNVVPQNEISPELAFSMLRDGSIAGVKQSLGGPLALMAMVQVCGQEGLVYAATDELLGTCFELGAHGAISAIVGLLPGTSRELWRAAKSGHHGRIAELQPTVWRIWSQVIGPQFPARMKAIMRLRGYDCGVPRSPLVEYEPSDFEQLTPLLDELVALEK